MKRLILLAAILVLLAIGAGAWWLIEGVERPYKGYDGVETFVEVPQGAGTVAIGRRLEQAGVVRSAASFRLAVWLRGAGPRLQAGEYRFDQPISAAEVVNKIARGEVYIRRITFREGLTIRQMAEQFESQGFGKAADFVAAANDVSHVRHLDADARDLEGYLFPDTYTLPRRATAAQLVQRMVAAFDKALAPETRQKAAARGLSVRELVTLASIVEKETGKAEERPLVASVYSNRLNVGMGLQCDPTVIYALERAGRFTGNLTRADLQFDSPYNTYKYAGLPPGPIASPGRASLEAAASPAESPYLYFVSRNDGSHAFAATLDEHNRNVHEWQIKYFKERRNGGS